MTKEEELSQLQARALRQYDAAMVAFDADDLATFELYKDKHDAIVLEYIELKSGKAAADEFKAMMSKADLMAASALMGKYFH